MQPMNKYIPLTEQLRLAIRASEKTRYQIAKETGISQPTLSRFFHGERGLSMEALDAVAKCLGLELRPVRQGKGTAKKDG
jgi:transcriptional regulator with XRE-family HTH domain